MIFRLLVPFIGILLSLAALARAATPFPHATSDLTPDAALHFGALPNGLRYVVMENPVPKGRTSLRLLVQVGSLYEAENERGLAHFLEHMAFNGSKHFPTGSLVETLQRMGMSFGSDTNARTSLDQTVYQLDLPDSRKETIAEGLSIFADYAGGLDLAADKIEKERGIILSEKRARDSAQARLGETVSRTLYPDLLSPQRSPIGTDEVIKSVTREQIVSFYNTWYRPEKMIVVAVGDFEAPAIIDEIKQTFGGLTARAPVKPEPDIGSVSVPQGVEALYFPEKESTHATIAVMSLFPVEPTADSRRNRTRFLARDLALGMLNRRLQSMTKAEKPQFLGATVGVGSVHERMRQSSLTVTTNPDQWRQGLEAAHAELRRALEEGFQETELNEIVVAMLHGLETSARNAGSRISAQLAEAILSSVHNEVVFTTAADDLARLKPAVEKITVADCRIALQDAWDATHRYVLISGKAEMGANPKADILAAYDEAKQPSLGIPSQKSRPVWAYTQFGQPGRVEKRERVEDLGVTLVSFANGVKLNLKKTDFLADQVGVQIRVGHGQSTVPKGRMALASFAAMVYGPGGLGAHSAEDVARALVGHTAIASFTVAQDAFIFSGGSTREDLPLTMQLLTAMLTDPGFRPEALWQARRAIEQGYANQAQSLGASFQKEVSGLMTNQDPRFLQPSKETMLGYTLDEVKAWLLPQLKQDAVEVAIIGDIDIEATIAAVADTLGALPPRATDFKAPPVDTVSFAKEPFVREYDVPSEVPQGMVMVYWPTSDGLDVRRDRRLRVLGAVLGERLRVKIREELGGTYTPNAGSNASDFYPGYGYLEASATVDPAQAGAIAEAIVAAADDLSQKGIPAEEMERVKNPIIAGLRQSARSNQYWMQVIGRAQSSPERLDWARTRFSDMETMATAEINALAKQYLGAGRASRVIVRPVAKLPAAAAQE